MELHATLTIAMQFAMHGLALTVKSRDKIEQKVQQ